MSKSKNEPAPSANDTSSKEKNQHNNDTTIIGICQAKVSSAADDILQIYDSMTQEEQRAFDLGEVYRRLLEIIEMEDKHNEE